MSVFRFTALAVALFISFPIAVSGMTTRTDRETLVIPAGQQIDDSLYATGETVRIDGVVHGDLIVLAKRLFINGTVTGNVLAFAQTVEVGGTIEGSTVTFSQSWRLRGGVGRNVYSWAQSERAEKDSRIGGDWVAFAGTVNMEGTVGRGARVFADSAELSGALNRTIEFRGRSLQVDESAQVNGNVKAYVRRPEDVRVASGATIRGIVDRQIQEPRGIALGWRIVWEIAWFLAALLTGLVALYLAPRVAAKVTDPLIADWRAPAVGFAVLVLVPVAIAIAALTIVGIPVALMTAAAYATALYLAKIAVALYLGRRFLPGRSPILALLVGLLTITVLYLLPWIGLLARLVVTCLGLGAFAWYAYRHVQTRRFAPLQPELELSHR